MPIDILCLGEAMVEFNQAGGPESDQYLRDFGGDTSNCVIAAARQGAKAGYVTQVGSDPFGDLLLDLWRREGVDTQGVRRHPSAPTGIYFVTHSAKGHAFSYYRKGSAASLMTPAELDPALLGAAQLLHVSGINLAVSPDLRATTFAAMEMMRRQGRRVAFDTNLRLKLWPAETARPVIEEAAARADILLPGLDDVRALSGLEDAAAALAHCRAMGPELVALKCGAEGVLLAVGAERWRIPGHRVRSVDATGAGDCFDGAFLAEISRGAEPAMAAVYANAAAALTTIGFGAVGPIPHRPAVEEFLRSVGRPQPEKLAP